MLHTHLGSRNREVLTRRISSTVMRLGGGELTVAGRRRGGGRRRWREAEGNSAFNSSSLSHVAPHGRACSTRRWPQMMVRHGGPRGGALADTARRWWLRASCGGWCLIQEMVEAAREMTAPALSVAAWDGAACQRWQQRRVERALAGAERGELRAGERNRRTALEERKW
jgi:hypothetical protein